MKTYLMIAMVSVTALVGCKDKDKGNDKGKDTAAPVAAAPATSESGGDKAPATAPATPPTAAVKLVELDLSPFGAAFKGFVAMAPEGAKAELDDPSRHIVIDDKDFVALGGAVLGRRRSR